MIILLEYNIKYIIILLDYNITCSKNIGTFFLKCFPQGAEGAQKLNIKKTRKLQ